MTKQECKGKMPGVTDSFLNGLAQYLKSRKRKVLRKYLFKKAYINNLLIKKLGNN